MDQLEVRVHSEINSYSEKFYGLTFRQWLCTAIALLLDVPIFLFLKGYVNNDILEIMIILITAPILAIGFIKVQDLPLEKFMKYFIRSYFKMYKPLKYQTDKELEKEKQYYYSLSFIRKIKYLMRKDKANDIPIEDKIKIEGKQNELSKKQIRELKALEKKKMKSQAKLDKKRKKEEKLLKKMYKERNEEIEATKATKVLKETETYMANEEDLEKPEIKPEKDDILQDIGSFYYDKDIETQKAGYIPKPVENLSEDKEEEIEEMKTSHDDAIAAKEDEIKNMNQKEEFKDSNIDLNQMMAAFLNSKK